MRKIAIYSMLLTVLSPCFLLAKETCSLQLDVLVGAEHINPFIVFGGKQSPERFKSSYDAIRNIIAIEALGECARPAVRDACNMEFKDGIGAEYSKPHHVFAGSEFIDSFATETEGLELAGLLKMAGLCY